MTENRPSSHRGFSLIEVVAALGIFIFAIVAIASLLPIGMRADIDSLGETLGLSVLDLVAADLDAAAASGSTSSPRYELSLSQGATTLFTDAGGSIVQSNDVEARFRIQVRMMPATDLNSPDLVHLTASWPAAAQPASASRVEIVVALPEETSS